MRYLFILLLCSSAYAQTLTVFDDQDIIIPEPPPIYDIYVNQAFVGVSNGSFAAPWKTIDDAANVAVAGDNIGVYSGTYRETITFANSGTLGNPITVEPIEGETPVVSGLEVIANTGWTVHSGQIYKKTITLPVTGFDHTTTSNTDIMANQIFKDGEMMFEARWPKISQPEHLLDKTRMAPITSQTATTLTNAGIPAISGGWVGGTVCMQGWYITTTSPITAHSGTTITFSPGVSDPRRKEYFYLIGKLNALTDEKEWHYTGGILYFRQPGGGSPTGVEYKARNYGFDLTGKSYITIKGLHFKGCDPVHASNTTGTNITIDNIRASYLNHAIVSVFPGASFQNDIVYKNAQQTGIKLIGANSVIKNSELQYGIQAVHLGVNCIAENNLIHDFGYDASWGCGVMLHGQTSGGQKILRNTIYRMGRSCLDWGWHLNGSHLNVEVAYNDFHTYGMITNDQGATYSGHFMDLTGSTIHHNWIHNSQETQHSTGIDAAIYFDQASGPTIVHHNVMWGNKQSDIYSQPQYEHRNAGSTQIYNNVMASVSSWVTSHSYKGGAPSPLDILRNNIYRQDLIVSPSNPQTPNSAFSITEGTNPLFVGTGSTGNGLDFRVQSGSPAINAGTTIAGITDGSVGAPDAGAYEFGATPWATPGYEQSEGEPGTPAAHRFEAESWDDRLGTTTISNPSGIGSCNTGDWVRYNETLADTYDKINITYAKGDAGTGTTEIRLGSISGTLIGTVVMPSTGSWTSFTTISANITPVTGAQSIFMVFTTTNGNFDWFEFDIQ